MAQPNCVVAPLTLGVGGAILYLATAAPTIAGTDAGELALAAYSRGVAHAPGFPTWIIPASLVVRLPIGEPAWRLNAFSALVGALTLVVLWAWLRQMPLPELAPAETRPPRGSRRLAAEQLRKGRVGWRESRQGEADQKGPTGRHGGLPLLAAVTFGVSRGFWPWATTTEVYTLNALLVALTLFFLFRWSSDEGEQRRAVVSPLAPAALCYGLALGAHLATTALLAPAIGLWLFWHRQRLSGGLIALCAAALVLGLSTYAVLPLAAASHPVLNWGEPDTWTRFWRHVTATQYRSNLSLDPASLLTGLRLSGILTFWQFSLLGLPFVLWGLWWGWRQQRRLTLFVLTGVLTSVLYLLVYGIEDDRDAYTMLAYSLLTVFFLWGLQSAALALYRRLKTPTGLRAQAPWLVLWTLPLLAFVTNAGIANRSAYWFHRDYYRNLTAEVAEGGAIFTRDWQFYSPSLYYQWVLGDRTDLRIVDLELMRRDWYLNSLERWYPELMTPAAAEMDAYRRLRDAWEADPAEVEADPARQGALQAAYVAAINALINAAAAQGEVRLSHEQEEGVGVGHEWAPVGLTFRLQTPASETPLLTWNVSNLQGRGYADDPARKVAAVHALMAQNRGFFLAQQGDSEGALEALAVSEEIEPGNPLVEQLRRQITAGAAP